MFVYKSLPKAFSVWIEYHKQNQTESKRREEKYIKHASNTVHISLKHVLPENKTLNFSFFCWYCMLYCRRKCKSNWMCCINIFDRSSLTFLVSFCICQKRLIIFLFSSKFKRHKVSRYDTKLYESMKEKLFYMFLFLWNLNFSFFIHKTCMNVYIKTLI